MKTDNKWHESIKASLEKPELFFAFIYTDNLITWKFFTLKINTHLKKESKDLRQNCNRSKAWSGDEQECLIYCNCLKQASIEVVMRTEMI